MKDKLTEKQAKEILYALWENHEVPRNFTEDHSEYNRAIKDLIKHGCLVWEEYF
jgi:hypothetical protein